MCIYIYICAYVYVCVCICICMCMCVYMYMYVYISNTKLVKMPGTEYSLIYCIFCTLWHNNFQLLC